MNISYLDLTNSVWTVKDFEENEVKVDGKSAQLMYHRKPPEAKKSTSWGASVIDGLKYWTGAGETNPLYVVSESLNKLAEKIIHGEHLYAQKALVSKAPIEERLHLVKEAFKHLENLKQNLEHHDVIVKAYNDRFIFKEKLVGCPTHQDALTEITNEIKQLMGMQAALEARLQDQQKANIQDFNKQLDQLEQNLENGLVLDKEVVLHSYPQLLEKAKQLGIKENDPSIRRLQTLLNSYYLANLIDKITQNQMPIPYSIALLLNEMGLTKALTKKITEQGRQALIARLQNYLKPENRALLEKPSPDFVRGVQQDFINIVVSQVSQVRPELATLRPLIDKLYLFETEMQKTMQQAQLETRAEITDFLKNLPANNDKERKFVEFILEKWKVQTFPSLVHGLLESFFNQIDLQAIPSSADPAALKAFQESTDQIFETIKQETSLESFKLQPDLPLNPATVHFRIIKMM